MIEAGEKGDISAQFKLAMLYKEGRGIDGTSADKNKHAYYWFQKAAAQGHTEAQFQCYVILKKGLGCERNESIAQQYLQDAAKQGHLLAQFYVNLEAIKTNVGLLQSSYPDCPITFDQETLNLQNVDSQLIQTLVDLYSDMKGLQKRCVPAEFFMAYIAWKDEGLNRPDQYGWGGGVSASVHPTILKLAVQGNALAQYVCGKGMDGQEGIERMQASADQGYQPAVFEQKYPSKSREQLIEPANDFIRSEAKDGGTTLLSRVPLDLVPSITARDTTNSVQALPPAITHIDEIYQLCHADNHGFTPDWVSCRVGYAHHRCKCTPHIASHSHINDRWASTMVGIAHPTQHPPPKNAHAHHGASPLFVWSLIR